MSDFSTELALRFHTITGTRLHSSLPWSPLLLHVYTTVVSFASSWRGKGGHLQESHNIEPFVLQRAGLGSSLRFLPQSSQGLRRSVSGFGTSSKQTDGPGLVQDWRTGTEHCKSKVTRAVYRLPPTQRLGSCISYAYLHRIAPDHSR